MHPFLEKIVTGSRFAGLEVQFLSAKTVLHLVVLRRKGQQVVMEKAKAEIENPEELPQHLTKDIPLAVVFTGKGILSKSVQVDPASDHRVMLSKVLPNASVKDFYVQVTPAVRDEKFVSLVRRSVADDFLQKLDEAGFSVVQCSLGVFPVTNILPLLGEEKQEWNFGRNKIMTEGNLLSEAGFSEEEKEKQQLSIGGQNVEAACVVAFSVAFQQLLSHGQQVFSAIESRTESAENFLQRKLFKKSAVALLAFVLTVLLGNYFAFSHYWAKKNELESKMQMQGGALDELNALQKTVKAKRSFLEQAGLLGPSHHSWYADQLAVDLPEQIRLTQMNIAPRLKLSDDDSIGFHTGEIEIAGNCSQSIFLNRWLQALKEKKWIHSAALENYVQDKTMAQGEFLIALELN